LDGVPVEFMGGFVEYRCTVVEFFHLTVKLDGATVEFMDGFVELRYLAVKIYSCTVEFLQLRSLLTYLSLKSGIHFLSDFPFYIMNEVIT